LEEKYHHITAQNEKILKVLFKVNFSMVIFRDKKNILPYQYFVNEFKQIKEDIVFK